MSKVVALSLFLALASVCQARPTSQRSPFDIELRRVCVDSIEKCAATHLTQGRCRDTWWGFQANNLRNDQDGNCQTGGPDFVFDVGLNYDTNGDKQFCRDEWIDRRVNYDGFTEEAAAFDWSLLTLGAECIPFEAFQNAPLVDTLTAFTASNINRLVQFCNSNPENMRTNRDCFGLIAICREKLPDLPACQTLFDQSYRTLRERIVSKFQIIDTNGDKIISPSEIVASFKSYDSDGNGCVDREEWRAVWTNEYGFSTEFSDMEFMYTASSFGGDCFRPDEMVFVPEGFEVSRAEERILMNVAQMCEAKPSLYDTNVDCAMVVDTCVTHYPDSQGCQIYTKRYQCGWDNYVSCIQKLRYSTCLRRDNRFEVAMEVARVKAHQADTCTPVDIELVWDEVMDPSSTQWTKPNCGFKQLFYPHFHKW